MVAQQKALILPIKNGAFVVRTVDIPKVGPGELLVKIASTALNPVDWKIQAYGIIVEEYPTVVGTDGAGVVEDIGEGVTAFAKGDKVFFQGDFNIRYATFQQYAAVPAEIVAKLPGNISLDEAASIPVGLGPVALAFYNPKDRNGVGLAPPWEESGRNKYAGKPIFILGGASSLGQYGIQLAKLSGFSPIITTASLHNTPLLQSLGATHVIDRHLPVSDIPAAVTAITSAPVELVYDTISLADTQTAGYNLLAPGGTIVLTLPPVIDESKRTADKAIIYVYGNVHPAVNRPIGVSLYSKLTQLLESGDLKPNKVEVLPNGLAGIVDGLARLQNDAVSARPQETN